MYWNKALTMSGRTSLVAAMIWVLWKSSRSFLKQELSGRPQIECISCHPLRLLIVDWTDDNNNPLRLLSIVYWADDNNNLLRDRTRFLKSSRRKALK